jgi:hypothetical protein
VEPRSRTHQERAMTTNATIAAEAASELKADARRFIFDLFAGMRLRKSDVEYQVRQVEKAFDALGVICSTPHIEQYLEQRDPKALAQVRKALGITTGGAA